MPEFVCEKCSKSFKTEEALNQHNNAKHSSLKEDKIFSSYKKQKRNSKILVYGVIAVAVVAVIAIAFFFMQNLPSASIGVPGSAHYHADIKVYIEGTPINFAQSRFQLQSQYIHFESGDGDIVHYHATGIPFSFFFETLGINLSDSCIEYNNANYCTNAEKSLKLYVNGEKVEDIENYIAQDLDKILLSYGSEDETAIQAQLSSITDKARFQ